MATPTLLFIGSYNQDLIWQTRHFPLPGETVVGSFRTLPGGKGSNRAVAAARQGANVAFCASVGDDTFGQALPGFYRQEGIHAHLAIKSGQPTGNAGIWVNPEGENEIVISPGANALLDPRDVPLDVLSKAGMVICENETNPQTVTWIFEQARANGVTTLLNPAPMRDDFNFGTLRFTDILVPNETEFAEIVTRLDLAPSPRFAAGDITAMDTKELHALCRRLGVPTVIITLGSKGCYVDREEGSEHVLAYSGVEVVDTTGAGDAFIGGLCAHLAEHGGLIPAVRRGCAVAALCVTKEGAAPAMPTRAEVEQFLR